MRGAMRTLGGAWVRAESAAAASDRVTYLLPRAAAVTLEARRPNGALFATLVRESQAAGEHALAWHGGGRGVFRLILKLDGRTAASASVVRP